MHVSSISLLTMRCIVPGGFQPVLRHGARAPGINGQAVAITLESVTEMKAVDVLQRILLPRKGEPHDVRMLYLIESEQNTKRASWPDRTRVTVPELSLIHI